MAGSAVSSFGMALARFPLMVPLALVIAVLSAALWVVIKFTLRAYLPGMTVEGSQVAAHPRASGIRCGTRRR